MVASLAGLSSIMFMPVCNSAGMKFAWTMKMQMDPFGRGSVLFEGETTLQIIAKAQYQAWINFIQEAEIELHGIQSPQDISLPRISDELALPNVSALREKGYYRQLNEAAQEIRLIRLNPGSFDEPLSFSLAYTSLRDPRHISYESLSYCWGDQKDKCNVTLLCPVQTPVSSQGGLFSEHVLSITSSLYSVLRHLRPKNGQARVLWIDAICIYQDRY
jgi:Heterokaryon incompatibility protein (HET)